MAQIKIQEIRFLQGNTYEVLFDLLVEGRATCPCRVSIVTDLNTVRVPGLGDNLADAQRKHLLHAARVEARKYVTSLLASLGATEDAKGAGAFDI
jgi:hypothetical protein